MQRFFISIVMLSCAVAAPALAQQTFQPPPNNGYVTVAADVPPDVLPIRQALDLEERLRSYDIATSNQIVIVIIRTLNGIPIEQAAVDTGRLWGVGTQENNNGIVLLIAYDEREIFLATGYGLEGAVPDIVAKGIIDRDMTPAFREGNFAEGLMAAVDALQKHIGGEYTPDRYMTGRSAPGIAWVLLFVFIALDVIGAVFARTTSWWLGGVFGGIGGLFLAIFFSWWLSIPILVILGLLFDYAVSKKGWRPMRRTGIGTGWGGRRGGGGFGGFGGGSFGGGGARGRW